MPVLEAFFSFTSLHSVNIQLTRIFFCIDFINFGKRIRFFIVNRFVVHDPVHQIYFIMCINESKQEI